MPTPTDPVPDDVRRWIDQQAEGERDDLARAWALAGLADAPDARPEATDDAWHSLAPLLDAPAPRPARRAPDRAPARSARWSRRAATVAVLLAVVAVAGTLAWLRPETVRAGAEVAVVALPDGSEVTLAPGSELAFRRGLAGGTRRVSLEGQGHFDVASDGRPFVVETFNARVEVLGTVFDVSAWPGAPETAVALVEGSVRLRSAAGGAVTLAPGQASRVFGGGAPTAPMPADVEAVTAWRAGGFAVVDAPLAAVAAAVAARYETAVRLGPGVDGARRLTLFLPDAASADSVLGDVTAYLDLRLSAGPGGFDLLAR